ncbi:hypothetical protein [Pantoea sp. 18069]|uniref:hypothetical protein n=1 Tax=Pantoea sp. 18069 TaxID=2681415 RepID=UPI00190F1FAD|nr:hypothetical protein [Pantoea sp. 18069]
MRSALLALPLLLLAGCNIPGIGPTPQVVARENEAKAVGSACRHALRGLEDCYSLNPRSTKALVFAGWKEMDQYMRENKIEGTPSVITQREKPVRTPDSEIETELRPATARNRS